MDESEIKVGETTAGKPKLKVGKNVTRFMSVDPPLSTDIKLVSINKTPSVAKKYSGYHVLDGVKQKNVIFVSKVKELMLFIKADELLHFMNSRFITNDERLLDFLRNCGLLGREYWEGDYPESVKRDLEERDKYLTRDPNEHERVE